MAGPSYQQFQGYPNVVGNYSQGLDAGRDRAATQFSDRQALETQNALVQQQQAAGVPVQSYPQLQAMQMQAKQMSDWYIPMINSAIQNKNLGLVKKIAETYRSSGNPVLVKIAGAVDSIQFLDKDKYKVRYQADTPEEMAALRKAMPSLANHPQIPLGVPVEYELEGAWGSPDTRVHSVGPVKSEESDKVWTEVTRGQVEEMKATAEKDGDADAVRTYISYIEGMNANKSDKLSVRKLGNKYVRAQKPAEEKEAKAPATRNRDVGDKQITEEWKDGAWVKIGEAPRWNTRGNVREDRLAANQQFKNERDMRKDFEALPEVKNFTDVNIKASQMAQAIEESRKTQTFVAVDQALITMFNKMTDPQSVVRESEYARTGKDIAMVNMIKGKAQRILTGGAGLTSEERNALKSMSDRFLMASKSRYNEVAEEYSRLAKTYGYEPNNVVFRGVTKKDSKKSPTSAEDVLAAFQKANPTMKRADIKADPVYLQQLQKLGLGGK